MDPYDILLLPVNSAEETELATGLAVSDSRVLMQLVAIELLTEKGSVEKDPSRGSAFLASLRNRRFRSERDVWVEFALSANEVLKRLQSLATPWTDRLRKIALEQLSIVNGRLFLRIVLTVDEDLATRFSLQANLN